MNKPCTTDKLKENIHHEVAAILQCVFTSLKHYVQLCMDSRDDYWSILHDRMQFCKD
jgi:hypothetical protein